MTEVCCAIRPTRRQSRPGRHRLNPHIPQATVSTARYVLLSAEQWEIYSCRTFRDTRNEAGYADLGTVKNELATKETGWGGSPTFIGSPQGQDCTTELSDIKKLVYANLTPEYKTQVTSRGANANSGKGMGE